MYEHLSNRVFATSAALALSMTTGAVLAGPASQEIIDARQESQIWTTYALSSHLRGSDLKVTVYEGTVTLVGKVNEDASKELAREIAIGVRGIRAVDNQIVVQSDYKAPIRSISRSYGDAMDDANTTAAVRSKLMWSKFTSGMIPGVSTKSGRVTLKGSAENASTRDFARSLAMNTPGVRSVDNQLTVSGTVEGEKGVQSQARTF